MSDITMVKEMLATQNCSRAVMILGRPDKDVVRELTRWLLDSYEDFMDDEEAQGRELAYIDGFLAWHNAYKSVLKDLENRTGHLFGVSAVEMLIEAMEVKDDEDGR